MTGSQRSLTTDAVPGCLDDVHALLDEAWRDAPDVSPEDRARFTVIVAELVANVVEHGRAGRAEPTQLELTIEIRGHDVIGTLWDDGAEPPRAAPGGRRLSTPPTGPPVGHDPPSDDEIDGLRTSGRGLLLVRSSADDLALTRIGGRNRWRFVVRPHVPH